MEESAIIEHLGMTEQQYNILKAIVQLNRSKIRASAANIDRKYKELFQVSINKSNLFRQMRKLSDHGMIVKANGRGYCIDLEGIKDNLRQRQQQLSSELDSLSKLHDNVAREFAHLGQQEAEPSVSYLTSAAEFFEEVNKVLVNAQKIYIVSPFANIFFTPHISKAASRNRYVELLIEKSFVKKELDIVYLTQFNLYVPFFHAYRRLKSMQAARAEVETSVGNISKMIATQPKLNAYFLEYPYGFDFLMPVRDEEPYHTFMYTRDEHNIITGGIHIRSHEIAERAQKHFLRECSVGTDLKSKKGKIILRRLLSKARKYSFKAEP